MINLSYFSFDEKKAFLERKGYTIEKITKKEWYQWGNHDGYGDWVEVARYYATKDSTTYSVDEAFDKYLRERDKKEREDFLNNT